MVANPPIERPNSSDFLVNQLTQQQRQADEQGRQSKYPFSISHSGTPDFTVLPNSDGTGAIVSVYDGAGNLVVATDPDTKYGLARPYTIVPMYPDSPGLVYTPNTAFTTMYSGRLIASNSCFWVSWNVTTSYGGVAPAVSASSKVRLYSFGSPSWQWDSPADTTSTSTSSFSTTGFGPYAVQVPEELMGEMLRVEIQARVVTGGASSAVAASPAGVMGTDYAWASLDFGGSAAWV